MYELLALCLTLAVFLMINATLSMSATVIWLLVRRRAMKWEPGSRARLLVALGLSPALLSIITVSALLLPAYFYHETRQMAEAVSFKLAAISAISALILLIATLRVISSFLATRQLTKAWMKRSVRIAPSGSTIPAYRIDHSFPVIAVIGILRPRLFIARTVLSELSEAELSAVMSHERAHIAENDNLMRTLLRACGDLSSIFCGGRTIENDWVEASEINADDYAAREGAEQALDLASALIKIARLAPATAIADFPAGASHIGYDSTVIARRVMRLSQAAESIATHRSPVLQIKTLLLLCMVASICTLASLSLAPELSLKIHNLIELIVSLLQ